MSDVAAREYAMNEIDLCLEYWFAPGMEVR